MKAYRLLQKTQKNECKNRGDNKSKRNKIVSIVMFLAAVATISGITVKEIINKSVRAPQQLYEVYLSSEYYKLKAGGESDITATVNFDTDFVSITSYVNSVKSGETVNKIGSKEFN